MITKAPFVIIDPARLSLHDAAVKPILHPALNPAGIPFQIAAVLRVGESVNIRRLVALDYPGRVSA